MASTEASAVFECTPEQFISIVKDYEKYPEFLSEIKECRVLERSEDRVLVEYKISLIKTFSYRLMMKESEERVSWELESGDIFKTSTGFWAVEEEEGRTRATYQVEAKFKGFIPGPITKGLVSVNLPGMMSAYHKRVKELYG